MLTRRVPAVLLVVTLLVLAACGGDDDDESGAASSSTTTTEADAEDTTTTTAEPAEALEILVTNDDGYAAPGIDAIVEALRQEPDVKVTVVAPASEQSGTGGSTTDGDLVQRDVETASGYPAVAVEGFPADSVRVALDELGVQPHLVVSGINSIQNIGPLTEISGTVGAALAAGRAGIPALAVSQGTADVPDYPEGVRWALEWVRDNRARLLGEEPVLPDTVTVANLNIPTCATGEVRGLVEVPVATETNDRDIVTVDCLSSATDPVDDIDGFVNGFVTLSELPTSP